MQMAAVRRLQLTAFAAVQKALLVWRTNTTRLHAVLAFLLVMLSASTLTQRVLGFILAVFGVDYIDLIFQVPFEQA